MAKQRVSLKTTIDEQAKSAGKAVYKNVRHLESIKNSGEGKAKIALLRRGLGKEPQAFPELWGLVYESLLEQGQDCNEKTALDEAVFTALTLYARALQGWASESSVNADGVSIGTAVARMLSEDRGNEDRVLSRMSALLNAKTPKQISYQLRSLITLLSSKGIGLDFSDLAYDLVKFYSLDTRSGVMKRWAEDYSRQASDIRSKNEENEENSEGDQNE